MGCWRVARRYITLSKAAFELQLSVNWAEPSKAELYTATVQEQIPNNYVPSMRSQERLASVKEAEGTWEEEDEESE